MIYNQQRESDLKQPGFGDNKYSPGGRELEYPPAGKEVNFDPSVVKRISLKKVYATFTHNKIMTKIVEILAEQESCWHYFSQGDTI